MGKYTKTINKTIWDTDKIHVGDIITTNINCYRRHFNISCFKSFEKLIREDFNVVAFVKEIKDNKITIMTADENGRFQDYVIFTDKDIEILHKNPFV